ncbi:hypothetical protein LP419_04140 [Massilia sp. H-1]|nr:hypothetical protein LP419_04140 [Massilia sp. H-1]
MAASSSWKMLDDAALASLVKCKFKADLDEAERDVTFPIQFVWTLAGPASSLLQLVPGSCAYSRRFGGFEEYNRTPTDDDGVLVRFLVNGAKLAGCRQVGTGRQRPGRSGGRLPGQLPLRHRPVLAGRKDRHRFRARRAQATVRRLRNCRAGLHAMR